MQKRNVCSFFGEKTIGAAHFINVGSIIFWDNILRFWYSRAVCSSVQQGIELSEEIVSFCRQVGYVVLLHLRDQDVHLTSI